MKTHILVANASEAKLYETERLGEKMDLINEYSHPASREKRLELVTDRPGHFATKGTGVSRGAYDESDPKEVEADKFAQQLAKIVIEICDNHHDDKMVIVAAPHFHGLLNKHYDEQAKEQITHAIEKDYTKMPMKKLMGYLGELTKLT
ncbi:MAG TPA: host attachment protein [Gammaproteobacteria bacterium]|nr:host attachment protein [Gammaproteobacteria bacterium]